MPEELVLMEGLLPARRLTLTSDMQRSYALISLAHPQVTLREWVRCAQRCSRLRSDKRKMFILRSGHRTIFAVFRYVVDPSIFRRGHHRILRLHDLVLGQLPSEAAPLALVCCSRQLALALGCAAVTVDVPEDDTGFCARINTSDHWSDGGLPTLLASGFERTGATLVRRLAA